MEEQIPGRPSSLRPIIILVAVVGVVALGIVSLIRERIVYPNRYQVSFTGEGKAVAKPDIAQLELSVKTERVADSQAAVSQNASKMNAVLAEIKKLGIEEKDIKTSQYSLRPVYDYPENGSRVVAGYTVTQEVTVKARNLDNVDKLIERASAVGANQIGSPSFVIDDMTNIKQEAREQAVAKAKEEAQRMAELTGLKLGKIVNVYENNGYPEPYYGRGGMELGAADSIGSVAPDIQAGENEVVVQITLTYEVK